jgi:hypothetical protein
MVDYLFWRQAAQFLNLCSSIADIAMTIDIKYGMISKTFSVSGFPLNTLKDQRETGNRKRYFRSSPSRASWRTR